MNAIVLHLTGAFALESELSCCLTSFSGNILAAKITFLNINQVNSTRGSSFQAEEIAARVATEKRTETFFAYDSVEIFAIVFVAHRL
jgi:hypothetical protein